MTDDRGAARERTRKRRRWQWVAVVVMAIVPMLTSFLFGMVEGVSDAHDPGDGIPLGPHHRYPGMAAAMPGIIAIEAHLWRGADEVERRAIANALALAAVAALSALPVLTLAQTPLGLASPAMIGWGLGMATLLGTRIVQRLRG